MMNPTRRLPRAALLLCSAAVAAAACSREELLEVETPDQIRPQDAATVDGAVALRNAAVSNFYNYFGGTTLVGANMYVGLLSDELVNARPGGEHIDQRAFNENQFPNRAWDNFAQAYTQLIRARAALLQYTPTGAQRNTRVGQLHALSAQALTIGGELFCNGVPLSNADDVDPQFTVVTNAQMFQLAVTQADSGLALLTAPGDSSLRYLARVAKARAQVNLGQWAAAAATVGAGGAGPGSPAVSTSFVSVAEFSATLLANGIYDWMVGTGNWAPSNREGINGLPYISARDPRVVIDTTTIRLGQDGSTRVATIQGYATGNAPTRLATGVEARLIEAEAALQAGNTTAFLAALNAARADAGARTAWGIPAGGLPALTDPGTAAGRVDLLFSERAFWMYLTAHRVGDLRRLVRQYQRPENTVWPTGAYFKGGTYGADQNITPSFSERNVSAFGVEWSGCTNRAP